ncbi:hypothetical protein DOK67_0002247 [Enterococcus sp. DIV0212c]|uniref:hypothetical protein n=1 Tax=Enterococcus sp. DIV0212c TaxID=2230867 RepID=UPI001A9AD2CF|nr:hypothetical protein [Enterococcus sp. DIV0212c]MBO1354116.1 hypothetical protein [Enterococcus sp. DIV0212c]
MELMIFSPPYKKDIFYRLMGKYFAEDIYQNKFPYLVNTSTTTWYLLVKDQMVKGFMSFDCQKKKTILGEMYFENVEDELKYEKLILKKLIKAINNNSSYPIETAVEDGRQKMLLEEFGFIQYKQTKNYYFLRRS